MQNKARSVAAREPNVLLTRDSITEMLISEFMLFDRNSSIRTVTYIQYMHKGQPDVFRVPIETKKIHT